MHGIHGLILWGLLLGLLGPTNSQGKVLQTWNSNSFATEADYNDWKSHIVDTNTASPPSLTDETDSWYQWDKDIYGLKVIDGGGVGYRAHKLYAKWNSSSSLSREYVLFEYPLNQPAPAGAEFNLSFKSYTGPAGQVSYSIYGPGPAIQFSDAPLLTFQSNNTFNLISTGNVPVSKGAKSIKIGAYITNMYDHACFLDDWVVTYGTGLPAQGPIVPKGSGSAPAAEAVKAMTERKLPPERYDIWFGKKDRLYLAGIWNLKKLPGTRENPADDMGTKEGFWKEDFNDYNWEPALVPWDINLPYPPPQNRHDRPKEGFSGVFWYRTTFEVTKRPSGTRALLFFGDISQQAVIYVNGQRVGEHQNRFDGAFTRGENIQNFTLDVTKAIRFGEKNVIVIRGHGISDDKPGLKGTTNNRVGMWLPCWMEFTPPVYLEKALLTPQLVGSSVKTKIRIQNTTGSKQTVRLRAVLSAYESYRYKPKHRPAVQTLDFGEFALAPGKNELTADFRLADPVLWWPDDPFLYQMVLQANGEALGSAFTDIGKERFGFREFTTKGDRFLLNGKSWFLGGLEPVEVHAIMVRPDYAANYEDYLFRMFSRQREVNIGFVRPHSGHYPWPYQDTADETGMLIHAERYDPYEVDQKNQPTPAYRQKIIDSLEAYWNHPSVVCYSLGNERWDSPGFDYSPILNALYDLYKEIDPSRPCGGSSGRRPYEDQPAKCDYYDIHDYVGTYSGPLTATAEAMEWDRQTCYRRYWGVKPFINGECGYLYWHRSAEMEKAFGAPVPKKIDPVVYAEFMQNYIPMVFERINVMGLRNQLNYEATRPAMEAMWFKRYIEQYRYAEGCRGFNLHQSPYHYVGPEKGEAFDAFRSAMSPLWVGTAATDRNYYADRPLRLDLLAVNDSRFDLKGAKTVLTLANEAGKVVFETDGPLPDLENGKRAKIPVSLALPETVVGGNYDLGLRTVDREGRELHRNGYLFHLVRSDTIGKVDSSGTATALYAGSSENKEATLTETALKKLGVNYRKITSFDRLSDFGLLIVGPRGVDDHLRNHGKAISKWLTGGGKLLCLEQSAIGVVPWMDGVQIMAAGLAGNGPTLADIVAGDHPVFKGFRWHEFDLWNGWRGQVCDNYILPLSEAVLTSTMFQRKTFSVGMAAAEYRVGKGLCLMSQIETVKRFDHDPIASQYLARLVRYITGNAVGKSAPVARSSPLFSPPDPKRTYPVDLSVKANAKRKSGGKIPDPRVWLMKAGNDLEDLPAGRQTFLGIPFTILPADRNSCLAVGPSGSDLPRSIDDAPVKQPAHRMFFLACTVGVNEDQVKKREKVGNIRIRYGENGLTSVEDIPLVLGENIIPYDNPNTPLLSGSLAWSGFQVGWYRGPDMTVGVSVLVWENAQKAIEIDSFSLTAGEKAAVVLLAVTGEKP